MRILNTTVTIIALFIACLCSANASAQRITEEDQQQLLANVNEIAAPGVPGPIIVFGERCEALVGAGAGPGKKLRSAVVAAARVANGRVVAFGHGGYFSAGTLEQKDTATLMTNALQWCGDASRRRSGELRVGIRHANNFATWLNEHTEDVNAVALTGNDWTRHLKDVDVLCINQGKFSDDEVDAIRAHIRRGRSLIIAGLGWGWLQLNPEQKLIDHPCNRILEGTGLSFDSGYANKTIDGGYIVEPLSPLCHARRAFELLVAMHEGETDVDKADIEQATWAATQAVRVVPHDDRFFMPLVRGIASKMGDPVIPRQGKPIKSTDALARVMVAWDLARYATLAANRVPAHPAAEEFPGVPEEGARAVRTRLTLDTSIPDWHSTGLYAAPGEVVTVRISEEAIEAGLSLRIGAHKDTLWHKDRWNRMPEITTTTPLNQTRARLACAFGGLVYIVVPKNCRLGDVEVTIQGAIPAPLYVHEQTDLKAWREEIRYHNAPWAELATDKVIITVPSDLVRDLEHPDELMEFWNRVLDAALTMTSKEKLMDGAWGLYHELGHNHQHGDWTFKGTVEVTCNLFTLYIYDKVCGIEVGTSERNLTDAARWIHPYIDRGSDFNEWKSSPFIALAMYVQLQQAFGWDAFTEVFAEYQGLSKEERPANDDEKRDQWMVRCSNAVDHNLGPFFRAWGIPTSEEARASIAELPIWAPEAIFDRPQEQGDDKSDQ